ncbi:hypothetical protein DPMN_189874 [Dreissena polymorpha]|uniref:Uncharacterized protein n=1 Tax=Dreissena polymorpha TaxID=45954 RepID=A0A9D4IB80_DREPO|nr:hypothetical protein DPMN_189874 [Dreissena polymorpha]
MDGLTDRQTDRRTDWRVGGRESDREGERAVGWKDGRPSQYHLKISGMPCFDVNTKLGTAMKVSLGRPVKINNFLTNLNITLIANRNLKKMEAFAGEAIKKISTASSNKAVIDAYEKEMEQPATPTVLLMMLKHWDL